MSLDLRILETVALPTRSDRFNTELHYGIELEFERVELTGSVPTYWDVVGDGSLREGGIEFVSQTLAREQLDPALTTVEEFLRGMRPIAHARCGIHVHLNMRPCTIGQLYSLLCMYILLEPSIFAHHCPGRLDSSFCVPVYRNSVMLIHAHNSIQMARRGENPAPLTELVNTSKYSAFNTAALRRFGTVELRQFPATLNFTLIREWIAMLTRMYDRATQFTDPLDVLSRYDGRLHGLQEEILGVQVSVNPTEQTSAIIGATVIAGHPPDPAEEDAPPSRSLRDQFIRGIAHTPDGIMGVFTTVAEAEADDSEVSWGS